MHKVYILLPVYNRKETTCNFIDCLLKQDYENYHELCPNFVDELIMTYPQI